MTLSLYHDTIVAPSTPPGSSALAIVRVSGPEAIAVVASLIDDPASMLCLKGGSSARLYLADANNRPIDDCIVHIRRSPASFTGEDLIEITPHGSSAIVDSLVTAIVARGARMAEPGEFSRRAYLNGKLDLAEVELIALKVNASTESELRGAQKATKDKFLRLEAVYDLLLSSIAYVDAEIDFGESDSVVSPDVFAQADLAHLQIESLIRNSRTRKVNQGIVTISLTGPPNVGKSSLFNALLSFERSIVNEAAGTTRDYVEAYLNIDGVRVKIVDTAGIRLTTGDIERKGIELGREAALASDISIRVTDPDQRAPDIPLGVVLLHNKVDLDGYSSGLHVSAKTGEGLNELDSWLREAVAIQSSEFSKPNLDSTEIELLAQISSDLADLDQAEPILLAEHLRTAIETLGQLLGHNLSEDSLNRIFSKLCIGK